MRTGGQILVDSLLSLGAKHGFCVPGESYLGILDGFYDAGDRFSLITCRQEGGASYMAEAYGKLSGSPGLCFVTRGPGASNAMIGLHTAYQDSTPMLLFVGQVERGHRGREAFQELSYESVFGSVAKSVLRIDSVSRLHEVLSHAWALSMSGRPGPVVLELPEDMLIEQADMGDIKPPMIAQPSPSYEDMQRVQDILLQVKKPLLVIGGACWNKETSYMVEAFASQHNIPVVSSFRRQDAINNHCENYIGELSVIAPKQVEDILQEADSLIILSSRFGDITSGGYQRLPAPYNDKRIIHVFPCADELQRVYYAEAPVVSTPLYFMQELQKLELKNYWDKKTLQTYRQAYEEAVEKPTLADGKKVSMAEIAKYLRQNLSDDTILTSGAGNYTAWGQRHYKYTHYGTEIGCTNGSMGYGVPAAIAARLYNKTAPIVCFAGDGCFLMTSQELATAVQYDLPVIILIVNNNCLQTIRAHQQKHFPNRKIATDLQNPDFAAYAESFGAFGISVERTEDFASAFESAQKCGKVAVINIKFDVEL